MTPFGIGPVQRSQAMRFPRWLIFGTPRQLGVRYGLLLTLLVLCLFGYPQLYAYHHARRAEQACDRQDCGEALKHLEKCLSVWPDSAAHHFAAARCRWREGDLEEAQRHLREADRGGWPTQEIQVEEALIAAQLELTPSLEAALGQMLRLAKTRADMQLESLILEATAHALRRVERRQEAAFLAKALIDLQPESWRSHWLLGLVLEPQDPDAAAAAYERSLAFKAEQPKVHRFLAIYSARLARPRETLDHLRAAGPLAAGDVEVVLAEAKARLLLGQLDEAQRLLDQTVAAVGAEDPRIWTLKGRLELDQHGPAEATPWLEKAAARTPYVPETVDAMIALAARVGDADKVRFYNERKLEYKKAGEEAKVLSKKMDALYRQAHADPGEMEATAFRLGQLMFLVAQDEAGVRWMETVLATNPGHAGARDALAQYYDRIGAPAQAARHRPSTTQKPNGP